MEPQPTGVYSKNVIRGPIGALHRALSERLPKWAILGLCFVGGSIKEVVTNVRQKDRLIATVKILGIVVSLSFDIARATKKADGGRNSRRGRPQPAGPQKTSDILHRNL